MGALLRFFISFFSKTSGGFKNVLKNFGSKTIQGLKNFKIGKKRPKPFNAKARRGRLRKWFKRLKDLFDNNETETSKNVIIKKTEDNPQDTENIQETNSYEPLEFEFKPKRYSKHDVLNNIIIRYTRENKHRTHRIQEIERRIEFIFNELSNREKANIQSIENGKIQDTDIHLTEPEPEPDNFNFFRWLKFRKFRFRRKIRKWKRRVKARIRKARMERERKRRERERKKREREARRNNSNNKNNSHNSNDRETQNKRKNLNSKTPSGIDTQDTKPKTIEKNLNNPAFDSLKDGMKPIKEVEEKHRKIAEQREAEYNKKMKGRANEFKKDLATWDNPKADWWDKTKAFGSMGLNSVGAGWDTLGKGFGDAWNKGKYFADVADTLKNKVVSMFENALTKTKEAFPKMFRFAALGGKAMAKFLKAIPLIGSILSAILGIFEIGNAKNTLEVRRALFSAIGGSIGSLLGFALGSFLPLIGNLIFGFLGGLLGDWLGEKVANAMTNEVIDFLPFDLYKSPLSDRMLTIGPEFEAINKNDRGTFNRLKPKIQEAAKSGVGLEPEPSVLSELKKVCQTTLNTAGFPPEFQLAGEGGFGNGEVYANPEQLDGARIVVERYKVDTDWKGRGFTHGRLQLIGGDNKVIYQAVTTERPVEGATPNQNLRIPAGTYNTYLVCGNNHGVTLRLSNNIVPLNRAILIHRGESVSWSEGCVVISQGNTFGGLKGLTGSKEIAQITHNEFYAAVWQLLGLNQNNVKANLWKKTKLPVQVFNKFGASSADTTAAKNAKGSEPIVSKPTHTTNRTIENNTTIQIKPNK